MRQRIEAELVRIEAAQAVRVLLAVESGSRAWGFPSADSDYDVRFIYIRRLVDYLSIVPRRDVLEEPFADNLDIAGWDLRKALQLAVRSNAVLIEWLASPARYRDDARVTTPLRDLAHAAARLPALEYHYDRSARRAFTEIRAADEATPLKRYCYALRSALALLWLRGHRAPPPMDLPSLMAGLDVPEAVVQTIDQLLVQKAGAQEDDMIARMPVADAFLEATLSETAPRPVEKRDTVAVAELADRLLASVLLSDGLNGPHA